MKRLWAIADWFLCRLGMCRRANLTAVPYPQQYELRRDVDYVCKRCGRVHDGDE